jgi:hypothetical protein
MGVLSVPTLLLSMPKASRHINHGVATADKLLKQIQELERVNSFYMPTLRLPTPLRAYTRRAERNFRPGQPGFCGCG